MSQMSISVVIPTYNRGQLICETVDSILNQTLPPHEVIVVDDGSTDNTRHILDGYADKITVISIKNSGALIARKTGIEHASGSWICPCDSDDIWQPNHLERFAKLIQTYPNVDVAFTNFEEFGDNAQYPNKFDSLPKDWWADFSPVDADGFRYLGQNTFPKIVSMNPIFPSSLIFTRRFYDSIGGLRDQFSRRLPEDSDFVRRAAAYGTLACDTDISVKIRKHTKNISGDILRGLEDRYDMLRAHLTDGSIPAQYFDDIRNAMRTTNYGILSKAFAYRDAEAFKNNYVKLSDEDKTLDLRLRYAVLCLPESLRDALFRLVSAI